MTVVCSLILTGCQTSRPVFAPRQPVSAEKPLLIEIFPTDLAFDAQTGEIKYTLPQPALVRIRIGLKDNGPLLLNLVDWEPRPAGPNVETWDFKDRSGRVDFGERERLMVVISAIPQNWTDYDSSRATIKSFRKQPGLTVSFPESPGKDADGNSMIVGRAPVRAAINPDDQKWLEEQKYEVSLYLDLVYVTEDEEGINPFTYRLDTAYLQPGLHIITVNVVGFNGEIGTESILVRVEEK